MKIEHIAHNKSNNIVNFDITHGIEMKILDLIQIKCDSSGHDQQLQFLTPTERKSVCVMNKWNYRVV